MGTMTHPPGDPRLKSPSSKGNPYAAQIQTALAFVRRPLVAGGLIGLAVGIMIGSCPERSSRRPLPIVVSSRRQPSATTSEKNVAQNPSQAPEVRGSRETEPANINEDLASLEKQIADAESEYQKYSGGLVKALLSTYLATLRQTHAMLQQRSKAWIFGIGLTYTVDGKPFVPPPNAPELLAEVEREADVARTKAVDAEADAARYSGGLVQAISLSTAATAKNTLAMVEQKRLSLKYNLPQYIAFAHESPARGRDSLGASESHGVGPTPTAEPQKWRIVEIDSKVTESNDSWWRYAWRLTLANDSPDPVAFDATIEFQDAEGFPVDEDRQRGLFVAGNSEKTFTGYALVSVPGASRVAKTLAKVRKTN